MTGKSFPLYAQRVWENGSGLCFALPKGLCAQIGLAVGDVVVVRVHPPFASLRVLRKEIAVPVEGFTAEELPPANLRDERAGK